MVSPVSGSRGGTTQRWQGLTPWNVTPPTRTGTTVSGSPYSRSSQNGGTPSISKFARKRTRALSTLRPGNQEATSASVAVLMTVGPRAFGSSGKPPRVSRRRVTGLPK